MITFVGEKLRLASPHSETKKKSSLRLPEPSIVHRYIYARHYAFCIARSRPIVCESGLRNTCKSSHIAVLLRTSRRVLLHRTLLSDRSIWAAARRNPGRVVVTIVIIILTNKKKQKKTRYIMSYCALSTRRRYITARCKTGRHFMKKPFKPQHAYNRHAYRATGILVSR